MDSYSCINDLLVNLFKDILYLEERALSRGRFCNLSMNDWHVIEAVGTGEKTGEPESMSQIAKKLSVTVSSLTTAMNGLYRKGYIRRRHGEKDRRVVFVSLTEAGHAAYEHHAAFHKQMIEAIIDDQTPEQLEVLVASLSRLMEFFRSFGQETEQKQESSVRGGISN